MPRLTNKKLNDALYDARRVLERAVNDARAVFLAAGVKKSDVGLYTRQLVKDLLREDVADGAVSTAITSAITHSEKQHLEVGVIADLKKANIRHQLEDGCSPRDLVELAFKRGYEHRVSGLK